MNKNLVTFDECAQIIRKVVGNEDNKATVIDYSISKYADGYPGFLGDYFSLKIEFRDVNI